MLTYIKSKQKNNEKGEGELLLILFFFIAIVVFVLVMTKIEDDAFDKDVRNGVVVIEGNFIALGENGNPKFDSAMYDEIPWDAEELTTHIRLYTITECEHIELPDGASGVYSVTKFPQTDLIDIAVAQRSEGGVVICVPEGSSVELALWVVK